MKLFHFKNQGVNAAVDFAINWLLMRKIENFFIFISKRVWEEAKPHEDSQKFSHFSPSNASLSQRDIIINWIH